MAWNPGYSILIAASTLITYWTALKIGRAKNENHKRIFVIISLILNLTILFLFKYFNFFNQTTKVIFDIIEIPYAINDLKILLPVGISFYTFQALSYTIDVYRGETKPERHLGIYALYVSFFPQLVAGPIERSTRLLPQFFKKVEFNYDSITEGLRKILWGFFIKVVIADRLAIIVDPIYQNPQDYNGIHLIAATLFFGIQIYCDFAGYSCIAIGAARTLGYDLMENFKQPFFSNSISEFWKRWHISLSTWFRDYLYFPLGGNRVKVKRHYINLMIVFLVSGLWHGANITFVIWGALHGTYLIISIATKRIRTKIVRYTGLSAFPIVHQLIKTLITFTLVSYSWIFFRSNNLHDAFYVTQHLFDGVIPFLGHLNDVGYIRSVIGLFGIQQREFFIIFFSVVILFTVDFIKYKGIKYDFLYKQPIIIRWAMYYFICAIIVFFGAFNSSQTFIYFQF
jgi:D-alanyl-lipoteichoic acid acyltransferase DltB (MBOAT superfamily)